MKLGILICDRVQPHLQSKYGDYPHMFKALLEHITEPLEVSYFSAIDNQLPEDIDICDVYMTSGSRWGVNDEFDWIKQLEKFIVRLYHAKKGFVGICFGHQLIAKALGGKVINSKKGWGIGVSSSKILIQKKWMQPRQSCCDLVVSHQDQISELPSGAEVLMGNEFCPYSMIQLGHHFLGMQGHPEFSHEYSLALMNSRKDRIPSERIELGEASLSTPTDEKLVIKWVVQFLANL